jgi:hypothetical protein
MVKWTSGRGKALTRVKLLRVGGWGRGAFPKRRREKWEGIKARGSTVISSHGFRSGPARHQRVPCLMKLRKFALLHRYYIIISSFQNIYSNITLVSDRNQTKP